MATHYGKPLVLSAERLNYRKKALQRINRFILFLINIKEGEAYPETEQLCYDIKNDFISAMDDDLNVSAALASIFINIKKINGLILNKKLNKADTEKIIKVFKKINAVLQIFDFDKKAYNKNVEALIKKREEARKSKNWKTADKIRDELKNMGVNIYDKKVG
jgi:cysteinyl-tRNA synthetase